MSFENERRNNSLKVCKNKIRKIKEVINDLNAEIAGLEAEIGKIKAETNDNVSRKVESNKRPPAYSPLSDFRINGGVLEKYLCPNSVATNGMSRYMAMHGYSSSETYESLESVIIPEGVTSIGNNAFSGCQSIRSVVIPKGVTKIGTYAFYNCQNLESVNIPGSVTRIEEGAFYQCQCLESVNIPNSVTRIRQNAFVGCRSLKSVSVSEDCEIYYAFYGDVEIIRR